MRGIPLRHGEDDVTDRALTAPDPPTIPAMLAQHASTLAVAAAAAGLAACWFTGSPLGLLAPVAAAFLLVPARTAHLLAAFVLAFVVALLAAVALAASPQWPVFLGLATLIGAIVAAAGAARTHPADTSPVSSLIHPDDRPAAEQAAARAFWSGIPQVVSCRQRQPDGGWRLAELRAEPGYRVGVEVDPHVHAPDEPWTTTDDLGETAEAIRAARVIEQLHGAAFAFDAAGRFTYATPIAQTSIAMTLEDLNRPLGGGAFMDGGDLGWKLGVHPDDYEEAAAHLRQCLRTGEPFNHEYRVLRATGDYVWHRFAIRPSRREDGRITGWYGIGFDIDVYRKTEAALRDREHTLSQLVDLVPSHLWRLTPDGEPVFYNRRMVDFLGFDVAGTDRPGMTRLEALVAAAVHPEDAAGLTDALKRSLFTGEGFAMRYRLRRADGAWRWMSSRAAPLRDEDGRILQWYGLCHDVDDQMHAEEALRHSERRLQQMIDTVPALIWCMTPEGTPSYLNQRLTDFLGVTLEELTAPDAMRTLADTHPDDRGAVEAALVRALETGIPFAMTYRQRRADGAWRWTEGRAEPLRDEAGAVIQWYGVCVDIDDLVRAKEGLQRRERQLQQLIEALPVHIVSWTPAGEITYVSRRYLERTGLSDPSFEDFARATLELLHPEDAERVRVGAAQARQSGSAFAMRYRRRLPDGTFRWMDGRFEPQRDRNGTITEWFGLSVDIDDEVRVQDELRERERFLWQLVETLPAMIDCAAPNGEPVYRSRQLREFLGYDLEDLDGTGPSRLAATLDLGVHPDDLVGVKERYARSLATGAPYARRHRLRRFDGEYRWVETRAAPMRDAEGAIVQWNVICLDIDGEVRAQEALRLAQDNLARAAQAASLAELSASIAHEVNQPLAAIVANSNACHRWLSAEPPNIERAKLTAERIVRDANSAADVVSRIRALFRQAPQAHAPAALDAVIREARDLTAEAAARARVRVEVEVDGSLPPIPLDRVQIQQVLVNLIRNGLEAMEAAEDRVLRIRVRRADDAIRTEVSDTGPGLAFPDRVFQPFFTTKAQGMGMGLAICRSIVEAHGGRLWAEGNAPQGATFVFTLPIEAKAEA